jgi:pimeloyl-ACP methyl ester carboxylesterase
MASQSQSAEPCIRKAYLPLPFGQLHYAHCDALLHRTQATPAILLLHMSASSSLSMYRLMRKLASLGYTSFAPDMPGFGNSDEPDSDPPDIAWYASRYYAAFSELPAFAQGCHVIGHHSGAVIGTELASGKRYGSFVRSLTCIGPAVLTAEQRLKMSQTFLEPFNRPEASGEHLIKTWKYLQWEGLLPEADLDLLHGETLDHVRAWKGRTQIYKCVWEYDCAQALGVVPDHVIVLGLCARDDILWPYFEQFKSVGGGVRGEEITGGNFGPDLDSDGILNLFIPFINSI